MGLKVRGGVKGMIVSVCVFSIFVVFVCVLLSLETLYIEHSTM